MLPKGIDVKKLNRLVARLRTGKLWAERHSYSLRIAYNEVLVASLHLYPGYNEAVLKLYGGSLNGYVEEAVRSAIREELPEFRIRVQVLR